MTKILSRGGPLEHFLTFVGIVGKKATSGDGDKTKATSLAMEARCLVDREHGKHGTRGQEECDVNRSKRIRGIARSLVSAARR